jgi:hypothetical protein
MNRLNWPLILLVFLAGGLPTICRADDQADANAAIASLQRLDSDKTLTPDQRQDILDKAVVDLDKDLPAITDAQTLVNTAQILSSQTIDPLTAVLEYWGRSDTEMGRLRPVADLAVKMLDQANKIASAHANDIANQIKSPDDKLTDVWQQANDLANLAAYQKARMQYALALATDISDAHRPKIIDDAFAALAQWDDADSGIQPQVRFLMSKLHVIRQNSDEIQTGIKGIESLLNDPDHKISPAPAEALLYEARCYLVIANLEAQDAAGAAVALSDAADDMKKNFPDDPEQASTLRLLNYRLLALRADQSDPAAKPAANAAAVSALTQLVHDFPSLRGVIYQQLAARLPPDADVTQLDPLLLEAQVDQGRQQVIGATPDQITDKTKLQAALAAAKEILARYEAKKLSPDDAVDASLLLGIFQEYLGDKISAVDSLLDHIERFESRPDSKADFALDRARDLIADLRDSAAADSSPDSRPRVDPQIQRLQNRFLPIAVNPPFNRKEFVLQYAAALLNRGKFADAVKYYQMVPDDASATEVLAARYGEMLALKSQLDQAGSLTADQQQAVIARIESLDQTVTNIAQNLLDNSNSETDKTRARSTLARTALLTADVTRREGRDPQKVLELLDGFEDSVKGLPDAKSLLNGALFLRVQSYMQLGESQKATDALVQYLNGTGGREGAQTVQQLLITLDTDLNKARAQADAATAAHDDAALAAAQQDIHQLAANRALLSGYLVQWSSQSADPKIHAYEYIYRRFDADAKRAAAELEADPKQRRADLEGVMTLYRNLQSPDNFALYQASLDPADQADKNDPDPLITLGIGYTAYDLGDYHTAKEMLAPLIHDQKLGEDNDQCWEATYKLLDAMYNLAQTGDPDTTMPQVEQSLKILYLIWRDGTGGPKWHDKFEQLRKEIMPTWNPPPADTSQG